MPSFIETLAPILARHGAAATSDWVTFRVWTEKSASGPGDARAAARSERFLGREALIAALEEAVQAFTPPVQARDARLLQYVLYLLARSGRADATLLGYATRVAQGIEPVDVRRVELFALRRFAGWADPEGRRWLTKGLRRLFDDPLFRSDDTLRWARDLDLTFPVDAQRTITIALTAQREAVAPGDLARATLTLIAPYPCHFVGARGWSALLLADFNYEKSARDFRDLEYFWLRGAAPVSRKKGPAADRVPLASLPPLARLADFPDFVTRIERLLDTRFLRSKAIVRGIEAPERALVKRWLVGKPAPRAAPRGSSAPDEKYVQGVPVG